jgi:putative SOS response-associated peptidase YedK
MKFSRLQVYTTLVRATNGRISQYYTILTTEANETMKYVHNIKQRMPVMLKDDERKLDNSNLIKDFAYPIKRI